MMRYDIILLVGALSMSLPETASGQARRYALTTTDGLALHNATADVVTFKGMRGVRVTIAPDAAGRPEYASGQIEPEVQAWIAGVEFTNGVIEAEVAGSLAEGAGTGARGFVGIAFRLQTDRAADGPQDIVPDTWTKIRIEVRGAQAKLFVNEQPQPTPSRVHQGMRLRLHQFGLVLASSEVGPASES